MSKLFLAGVLPGILMCCCLAVAAYILAIKHKYPAAPFPGLGMVMRTAVDAVPGLVTAVIIVGGTLSGVFTVTESGAFGAIYALLLTTFYYRSLSWAAFLTAVTSAVRTTSMVMVLIAFASSFAYLLVLYQVPGKLSCLLVSISENRIVILLMINVILLVLGLGLCTPPVGSCLFVGCAVGKIKIEEALKSIWSFYIAILAALILVTFVPSASLYPPSPFE